MPSWITHLVTANKLSNKIKINDKNSFLFGNIMPDILINYIVKNTSIHKNYKETHFSEKRVINGISLDFPQPENFFNLYKENMNNSVVLGYYIHLITDYFWNEISYSKYFKGSHTIVELQLLDGTTKKCSFDDAIHIKQKDFKIFTEYLKNNNKIERIKYTEDLLKNCKQIKEIPLTKEDIENSIVEVENYIIGNGNDDIIIDNEYKLFHQNELQNYFDESIEYIIKTVQL